MKNKILIVSCLILLFITGTVIAISEDKTKESASTIKNIIEFFKSILGKITGFVVEENLATEAEQESGASSVVTSETEINSEIKIIEEQTNNIGQETEKIEENSIIEPEKEILETENKSVDESNSEEFTKNISEDKSSLNETEEVLLTNETSFPSLENSTEETSEKSPQDENIKEEINSAVDLDMQIFYPEKITRGNTLRLEAVVLNVGNIKANNVVLSLELPEEFETNENLTKKCGDIETEQSCNFIINIQTSTLTLLGKNKIKVLVNYENK